MSSIAQIQDGKIVDGKQTSAIKDAVKSGSTMDKQAFLNLLVAQMKYQDPLQPTSNTEFIAQYAQFSSLEQMQNMSATLELSRASGMVGNIVSVNTKDSYGNMREIQGHVDYVVYENNKAYVSIEETLYPLDDVFGITDQTYLDAIDLAKEFNAELAKLPKLNDLTIDSAETILALNTVYSNLTEYEKSFISDSDVATLEAYVDRVRGLLKDEAANQGTV